jgi:hypothetical protein
MITIPIQLSDLMNPPEELLQELQAFCAPDPFAPFSANLPKPDTTLSMQQTTPLLICAILGLLEGEKQHPIGRTNAKQADYLQMVLLLLESNTSGISPFEILQEWQYLVLDRSSLEGQAVALMKSGCPIEQIALKLMQLQNSSPALSRTLSWAILYAGFPKMAVEHAVVDGFVTCRGIWLEIIAFLVAAISYAFFYPPAKAVRIAQTSIQANTSNQAATKPTSETDAKLIACCQAFCQAVQTSATADECFALLRRQHTDPAFFAAAGAIYGIHLPMPETLPMLTSHLYGGNRLAIPDLANRILAVSKRWRRKSYPWE